MGKTKFPHTYSWALYIVQGTCRCVMSQSHVGESTKGHQRDNSELGSPYSAMHCMNKNELPNHFSQSMTPHSRQGWAWSHLLEMHKPMPYNKAMHQSFQVMQQHDRTSRSMRKLLTQSLSDTARVTGTAISGKRYSVKLRAYLIDFIELFCTELSRPSRHRATRHLV